MASIERLVEPLDVFDEQNERGFSLPRERRCDLREALAEARSATVRVFAERVGLVVNAREHAQHGEVDGALNRASPARERRATTDG